MKSLRDQCRTSGESKMKRMTGGASYAAGGKVSGTGFRFGAAPEAKKAEMRPAGKAAKRRLDRPARANGGKVMPPTVNINLPPKAGQPPMLGPMPPMGGAIGAPPMVPPMGDGPAPAVGLGPAVMPMVDGQPPVPPQDLMNAAPPMRRGGRMAYRKGGAVKMKAGAGSAEGRLEKL